MQCISLFYANLLKKLFFIVRFSLIVATELCKILIAGASFATMSRPELKRLWLDWSLAESLTTTAPPAVLYAIQNILVQASYQHNINSMMFNLVCAVLHPLCVVLLSPSQLVCAMLFMTTEPAEPNQDLVGCTLGLHHHGQRSVKDANICSSVASRFCCDSES